MAISTLSGLAAALQPPAYFNKATPTSEAAGTFTSTWYHSRTAAFPTPPTAPPTTVLGSTVSSPASGALLFANPQGGNNAYLAMFESQCGVAASAILIDRLWNNLLTPGANTTSVAVITIGGMSTLPARDANGTTQGYLCGVGMFVYSTTGNNAVVTITASYTNHSGTSGRTATCQQFFATCQQGTLVPFNLQAGDVGIRSVETVQFGASLSIGNVGLVIYRQLAMLPATSDASGNQTEGNWADALSLNFPRLYAGTAMEVAYCMRTGGGISNISGEVTVAHG